MANPLYYDNQGPFSLNTLFKACGGSLTLGRSDMLSPEEVYLTDVSPLTSGSHKDLALCALPSYRENLQESSVGFCIVSEALLGDVPPTTIPLLSMQPQRDFATICRLFYPFADFIPLVVQQELIHPEAIIDPTAQLGIGVVVHKGAVIGPKVKIAPYTVIGPGVHIGSECRIGSHVSIYYASLGKGVFVGSGSRIGQEGFGFIIDEKGYVPIPQIGSVIIEDGVHVGSNVAIDRGSLEDTKIGAQSRIDNLVQVAHNVVLGEGCVLVAQVGVAGSTRLGNYVMAGGQAGFAPHLTIGEGAKIAAQSGVMEHIEPKQIISGSPSLPIQEWRKLNVLLRRLVRTGSFSRKNETS